MSPYPSKSHPSTEEGRPQEAMAARERKRGPKQRKDSSPGAPISVPPLPGSVDLDSPPPPQVAAAPPRQSPYAAWWQEPGAGISGVQSSSANPWGSYLNFLQQPNFQPLHPVGENSHFVGVPQSLNPPSPAPAPYAKGTQPHRVSINIDDAPVKKRFWSHEEEVRLASAWLNTSKDPIHGNDKNSISFWGQITEKFNKDSQPDRIRDSNQLKVHWSRLSTTINEFNGYWSSVCKMNKSGYSDDQLMDEAQKLFTQKHNKPFAHVHWWRILKSEPKWCASVAQTEKDKNKTIEIDDRGETRPVGRETAKAERKVKRKAEQLMDGVVVLTDNINKIAQVAEERKKEREQATEAQLELTRMNMKIVEGQKEVKLLQVYNSLLIQDTSNMTDEEKASRAKTLLWMQKKMMASDEEA